MRGFGARDSFFKTLEQHLPGARQIWHRQPFRERRAALLFLRRQTLACRLLADSLDARDRVHGFRKIAK